MNERLKKLNEERKAFILRELSKSTVINKVENAFNSLDHSIEAMEKLSKYMASIEYGGVKPCGYCKRKGMTPDEAGKTLAYIAKMVNEITRLLQFAKGEPDSRTEVKGLDSLLQYLSRDQFDQLTTWIEEAQVKDATGGEPH